MSINIKSSDSVFSSVQNYYGKVLHKTEDLRTNVCTVAKGAASNLSLPYKLALANVPPEVDEKFYGCGNPVPLGIKGLNVLDLGCGSGRDCYIAAQFTGEEGIVTGIDMTQELLDVANKCIDSFTQKMGYGKPNLRFVKGYMEYLEQAGIARDSQHIVISNCVINLSPNKKQVLQGVYDVLNQGGEFYFSDIYVDRRLPEDVRRKSDVLYNECASGALYINDFVRIAREVGFCDPRQVSKIEIKSNDPELRELFGEARFFSITYRLFKLSNELLEPTCEDYGQYAIYKGTIDGMKHSYVLDDHHKFETNKPVLISGNTAAMLSETWLAPHFTVVGDRSTHYGEFSCTSAGTADIAGATSAMYVETQAGRPCCG